LIKCIRNHRQISFIFKNIYLQTVLVIIYTRKGLDIKTRELLTFSMILSLGGCEPQLKGHIQGNLNVGNDKEVLLSAVTQLLPYVGYPRALNAIRCINEIG
jgi:4-carboxymuconolactone decarboxylase